MGLALLSAMRSMLIVDRQCEHLLCGGFCWRQSRTELPFSPTLRSFDNRAPKEEGVAGIKGVPDIGIDGDRPMPVQPNPTTAPSGIEITFRPS